MRDITIDEGNRPLRIVRRSSGSVVTWRRAQMVLLWAQATVISGGNAQGSGSAVANAALLL